MAEYAKYILKDPSIHQTFRENAYAKAREFDIEKIVQQYVDVYDRALQNVLV